MLIQFKLIYDLQESQDLNIYTKYIVYKYCLQAQL